MIEPWFPKEISLWLSYLSLFSVAAVLGHYVKQGRHRMLVTSMFRVCAAIGVALLAAGATAALLDQPRYVVFPLVVSGSVMSLVFIGVLLKLRSQYTEAELRRITAGDM